MECNVILNKRQTRKALKQKGTVVFLGLLKSVEEEPKEKEPGEEMHHNPVLQGKIHDLKKRFHKVFSNKLPGLPPKRKVEHPIDNDPRSYLSSTIPTIPSGD